MRMKTMGGLVLLVAVVMSTPAGTAAGANSSGTKKVRCHVEDHIQEFPTASSPGTVFSFVRCPAPFGHGIQHATFRLTPKTSTTGTAVLRLKAYFDTGTVSGVWRATYRYKNAKTAVFKQKVKWTGGTGAFKQVRAKGTGTGVQRGFLGEINQVLTISRL
ncbi:MAG TPA: hypothetical protein VFI54_02205 [Solirubrobacteraceae bacterium]|nr:hypothetical protein [Solirubrobacteraceae bacterium]